MIIKKKVLISGFNARPLTKSLFNANYEVFAVDFFGDSDIYPYVKDSLIITKELKSNFQKSKSVYSDVLADLTVRMIEKYSDLTYLIIGSGLDDNIKGRERIANKIISINHPIRYLGNDIHQIIKARNILNLYSFLEKLGYKVPETSTFNFNLIDKDLLKFPFILKKKQSSGGINIFKINSKNDLLEFIKINPEFKENFENWFVQEYIGGIDVSCTTISNNVDTKIISINEQLIGENYLNAPSEFIYCGNIVPAKINEFSVKLISEISLKLVNYLNLVGINGFDFVLKREYPYLMEINPRIPGSINATEYSLNTNLLKEHINCCLYPNKRIKIPNIDSDNRNFVSKFIYFAPKIIPYYTIEKIKQLNNVEDIPAPDKDIQPQEPLCTILYKAKNYSTAYKGALNILKNIESLTK